MTNKFFTTLLFLVAIICTSNAQERHILFGLNYGVIKTPHYGFGADNKQLISDDYFQTGNYQIGLQMQKENGKIRLYSIGGRIGIEAEHIVSEKGTEQYRNTYKESSFTAQAEFSKPVCVNDKIGGAYFGYLYGLSWEKAKVNSTNNEIFPQQEANTKFRFGFVPRVQKRIGNRVLIDLSAAISFASIAYVTKDIDDPSLPFGTKRTTLLDMSTGVETLLRMGIGIRL
jgi:hypothetical protein